MLDRATKILLEIGALAVVLVALPYKLFELDRYFVPKEFALHIVALLALITLFARGRSAEFDRIDGLIALFLLWSAGSALFATNHWLAQRSFAITLSGAILFWATRKSGISTSYRGVLVACAGAGVVAAATSLVQAYGLETEYFSTNRAPGGTFGNRNFVAHIAVITLPALVWSTVTARKQAGALIGSFGVAIVSAALVLSRSRAAWLALAASALVLLWPMLASRKYWSGAHVGGRFARLCLAAVVGAIIAVVLPNSLNWNSDSPYLDSARKMVDYKSGSGRGRVAQYENSLYMSMANPIFGVGPGNWPVQYVRFAPTNDRSLTDDGMTANPWPSSDWVAFMSERGFVAAIALLAALALLFMKSLRRWRELGDGDAVLAQLVLAGTIVTTMVVSSFDAVLLLAAPAFLFWSIAGATSGIRGATPESKLRPSPRGWTIGAVVVAVLTVIAVARSATEVQAMTAVGRGGKTSGWVAGASWDPGSYRINARVAEFYRRRGRCQTALSYAKRAAALFPHARAPRNVINSCE
ncbi:MAG TPA: O-antigen ligase family protein [Gemmatimonadaceae bacterium]